MNLFLALIIVSLFLHPTHTATNTVIQRRETNTEDEIFDYKCGKVSFTNEAVKNAALAGRKSLAKSNKYPVPFSAPYYDQDSELVIWPIKDDGKIFSLKKGKTGIYYIVLDPSGRVKDVVAKMMNSQYIRCAKINRLRLELSLSMHEEANGYECGYEVFGDIELREVADLAFKRIHQNNRFYHSHKIPDYDFDNEHFLWPISTAKNYNPVLSAVGEVKGAKVKLLDGSLCDCQRVRLPEKRPGNDSEESLEELGYQCGIYFFGMRYLERSAGYAKRPKVNRYKTLYPIKYSGSPFNTEVYLYPIFFGGRVYNKGKGQKYFVAMNKLYKVIGVVIKAGNAYQSCEERTRSSDIIGGEEGDFICGDESFDHDHLVATAKEAFERLGKKSQNFPARYEGPDFDITGPYLTWPLVKTGFYSTGAPGKFRLVLNEDFKIAGAIFQFGKIFYKCKRASDGSIPGGTINDKEISEIYKAYRLNMSAS